jgi:MinD-like ATPase involved in chromosome partitioning or flagellar assembly
VGFCLEQDELLSYDTRAPQRNAATVRTLEAADVVVVVGTGDPVGIQRLVRGLTELTELGLGLTRVVVVNRVRSSVAGPRPAEAVMQALARYAGVVDAVLVPEDRAATDTALLEARMLREVAPGSPARRAIAQVAARLETLVGTPVQVPDLAGAPNGG